MTFDIREPLCTVGGAVLIYLECPTGICKIQVTGPPFGHETTEATTDISPIKFFPILQKEEEKRFPQIICSQQSRQHRAGFGSQLLINFFMPYVVIKKNPLVSLSMSFYRENGRQVLRKKILPTCSCCPHPSHRLHRQHEKKVLTLWHGWRGPALCHGSAKPLHPFKLPPLLLPLLWQKNVHLHCHISSGIYTFFFEMNTI